MTIEFERYRFSIPAEGTSRKIFEPIASLTAKRQTLEPGMHEIVFKDIPTYHADVKPSGTAVMKRGIEQQRMLDALSEVLGQERNPNVTDVLGILDETTRQVVVGSTLHGKPHKIHGALKYKK